MASHPSAARLASKSKSEPKDTPTHFVWSTINSVNVLPAMEVTSNKIFELSEYDHCADNDVCNVDAVKEPQSISEALS